MISPEEKLRILLVVEGAITTARVDSGLYLSTEDDKALMQIWRTLWLVTDLVSAELDVCRSKLSKPLVEVERREPEALSGTLDAKIERLHAYNKILRTELRRMVKMFPDADAQYPEQQPAQEQP